MLRTGKEHIERLQDGRIVYIGNERVDDVTTHPAFRDAAQTVAAIYDMKADPTNRAIMSFTEDGDVFSMYYLQARTPEDLRRRMRAHRMIAVPRSSAICGVGSARVFGDRMHQAASRPHSGTDGSQTLRWRGQS